MTRVPFTHIGPRGCDKPAFLMDEGVVQEFLGGQTPLPLKHCVFPDGSAIAPDSPQVCGSCGEPVLIVGSGELRPELEADRQ